MRKKISLLLLVVLSITMFMGCSKKEEEKKEITISIAASLVDSMNEIIENYNKDNDVVVNVNSGGSGALKKQIASGAEVDLFFSANEKYMDELIDEGFVNSADKTTPISNALVLIKNNDAKEINELQDLKNAEGKIAVGELGTVPAGQYTKTALDNIGLWNEIEDKVIFAKDVTIAKSYVEKGEAEYGFVYKSDALDLTDSEIVLEVPNEYYGKVVYALAKLKDTANSSEVAKLIDCINSNEGKAIFEKYGFVVEE